MELARNISLWCVLEGEKEGSTDDFMDLLFAYYIIVYLILASIGFLINITTFVVQLRCPKLRKGSFVYLMSSTVSYLLASLSDITFLATFHKGRTNSDPTITFLVLWGLKIAVIGNVVWNIVLIAVDKFISLFWPLRYNSLVTSKTRYKAIALSITVNIACAIMLCISFYNGTADTFLTCTGDFPSNVESERIGAILFVIMIIFVIVLYGRVLQLAYNILYGIFNKDFRHAYILMFTKCSLPK
ncbi:hypothetical protein CAPTEDRAFT_215474 [Capitella teleta]|uniref:G-protein coupled receptors family 1 profile domain-containing protein n=1 Tax=Capitella teleta TaxID=283909 RepID=R7U7M2_CAPTE|nr:hypothetical protein CAPTEDRAFT_215474 [Capitella teleta]|eukprot:ELT99140.1 hypothetical protein CAPTEDRAFT_215474 [Capitella teleta]